MDEKEVYWEAFPTEQLPDSKEDIWFRSELPRILDKILEEKDLDEKFKEHPLWLRAKSLILTFWDDLDEQVLINLWEAMACKYYRSLPPNKQTLEESLKVDMLRILFRAFIKRGVGTPIQKINERIAILSQWKISTPIEVSPQPPKPSIWKRLFGV